MTDAYVRSLLGERERILLVTRQHWFVFMRSILFEIVVALVIVGIVTALMVFAFPGIPLIAIGYAALLIPVIGVFQDFLRWDNQKYIITNLRVIQVAGFFNKNVVDSSLEKVNDVKLTQSFLGRVFGYGDIEILTASELGVNLFRRIGEPIHFKTTMLNAKEQLEGNLDHLPTFQDETRPEDVPGLIAELDKLRQQGILTPEEFQNKKNQLLSKI